MCVRTEQKATTGVCKKSLESLGHNLRTVHGTRPQYRTNRATHRKRRTKSTLFEHRQALVSPVWAARLQPISAFDARQQADGLGKLTVSETPGQREGTTTERQHQKLYHLCRRTQHACCQSASDGKKLLPTTVRKIVRAKTRDADEN